MTLTYQPEEETFADFLRRVRLGFGVADKDFARFLGVQPRVLARWMTGDTRYLHASRRAKWETLGIFTGEPAEPTVFERLRNEVEALVDENGKLLYSERDLEETIEWIQLFRASKDSRVPAAEVRKWARSNGLAVPVKGKVPTRIRVAYDLAHAATE